jgi:starvation-inducible DNA-binding protein
MSDAQSATSFLEQWYLIHKGTKTQINRHGFATVRVLNSREKGGVNMAKSAAGKGVANASELTDAISKDNSPTSDVVEHLQKQVANAFVLYANYKHYHWQTYGPLFRDLHLLWDEFAQAVLATIDDFAERLRMIGQDPVFRPEEIERIASVQVSREATTMREMIEEADANLLVVINEMRMAARVADDHDDPGTVDLFSRHVQIHEKHEWWLRDILEKDDGLTT